MHRNIVCGKHFHLIAVEISDYALNVDGFVEICGCGDYVFVCVTKNGRTHFDRKSVLRFASESHCSV